MDQAKHSPAPWRVIQGAGTIRIRAADGSEFADGMGAADASLIAAAPALLAAVRELMRSLRNDVTALEVAPSRVEAWGRALRGVAEAIEAAEATASASPVPLASADSSPAR